VEFDIMFPDKLEAPRDELIGKLLPKRKEEGSMDGLTVYPMTIDMSSTSSSSSSANRTGASAPPEHAESEPIPPQCHVQ
jgi:hypothetical protein